jgi:hypothetical protein
LPGQSPAMTDKFVMKSHAIQRCLATLAIVIVASSSLARAQQQKDGQAQQAPKPASIDRNGVLMLVRSALLALDQANKTGNYTVLHDMGAPGFQVANNPARLGDIFAKLRNDKVDLAGVAVIDPQLSLLPQIESNGLMHMAGFFPSVPSQVNFELLYAPVDGQWRLFGISVNVGQSGPVAPTPPAEPPAPAPAPKPAAKEKGAQSQPPVAPKTDRLKQ